MPSREDSGNSTTAPFDRADAHHWAKRQRREIRSIDREIRRRQRWARLQLWNARRLQRKAHAQERLAQLPVKELARGKRINTKALTDSGVRTASDVRRRGKKRLASIKGISEASAATLMTLARSAARVQPEDERLSADPTDWTAPDHRLVRALQALAPLTFLLGSPDMATLRQVLTALRSFTWATNWLRWLVSGDAKRADVRSTYPAIRTQRESSPTRQAISRAKGDLAGSQQHGRTTDRELEDNWHTSSSDLLALLDETRSKDGRRRLPYLAAGDLSQATARDIDQQELDKTLLVRRLRAYQEFGAKFALVVGHGLLGDEMGLGKTIQALAAIGHATSSDGERHHIVVCPRSLIDNWLHEIDGTLHSQQVRGYAFRDHEREKAFAGWKENGGILLTTYRQAEHLLREDLPKIGFIVVDEAHKVKNPDAISTDLTSKLLSLAKRALLMSGTLMENRAKELIDLSALADPAQGARLRAKFGDGSDAADRAWEFRQVLADFYLRRNQEKVLTELPDTIRSDDLIDVGEEERLACKKELAHRNLAGARRALTIGNGAKSAKLQRLYEIVEECRATDKRVLIFTEFLHVLDAVQEIVGNDCAVLHGSTPNKQGIVDAFQRAQTFSALAMQIRVGGEGFNLQSASVVVLMEPQYKPSTEEQAIARAHRMGQISEVVVYRLIAERSADERIVELTNYKAELFNALVRGSELADSIEAMDRRVDQSRLLEAERRRFEISEADDD